MTTGHPNALKLYLLIAIVDGQSIAKANMERKYKDKANIFSQF